MRRSRNALWLLLAALAASLFAVGGVKSPHRPNAALGQPGRRSAARAVKEADRCSVFALVHGPITPLSRGAIARRADAIGCVDANDRDALALELARLSGTGVVDGASDFVPHVPSAISQRLFDWAGLCADARHSVGAAEVQRINEQRDGIGDRGTGLDAVELALAVSRFSGPRPACVVGERDAGGRQSAARGMALARGAILRRGLSFAGQFITVWQGSMLATLQAARRSAGRAIGVALTSPPAASDGASRHWLEQPSPVAGCIRM